MALIIVFYILYLLIIFVSLCFVAFLFVSVYSYKQKDRIPVVYIYIMIACNVGVCFVEFYSDIFPYFISKKAYKWIYKYLGEYLTIFDYFVYTYPLLLTVLMIIERIYVIFSPFGRAFTDQKLWFYCLALAMILLALLLIPFFSGCAVNYSFYTFDYTTACDPEGHIITYIFDTYTGLIPAACLVLNFALIFYISHRRKKIENPADRKLNARQSHEKTLLIQSISSTTFLLIYEITEIATDFFSEEYEALPGFTRRMIYYARAGSVAFTCFFIYFVGTASIRRIIIAKMDQRPSKRKISADMEEPLQKKSGFAHKKENDIWNYVLDLVRNPDDRTCVKLSERILHGLMMWEEMKKETETVLTAQELHTLFHGSLLPKLCSADLSTQAKACLYYGLQIEVPPEFLKELQKKAHILVGPHTKLIGFWKKTLEGETSSGNEEQDEPWYNAWDGPGNPENPENPVNESEDPQILPETNPDDIALAETTILDWMDTTIETSTGEQEIQSVYLNVFNSEKTTPAPVTEVNALPIITDIGPKDFEPICNDSETVKPHQTISEALLKIVHSENSEDRGKSGSSQVVVSVEKSPEVVKNPGEIENLFKLALAEELIYSDFVLPNANINESMPHSDDDDDVESDNEIEYLGTVNNEPKKVEKEVVKNSSLPNILRQAKKVTEENPKIDAAAIVEQIDNGNFTAKISDLESKLEAALERIHILEQNTDETKAKAAADSAMVLSLQSHVDKSLERVTQLEQIVNDFCTNSQVNNVPSVKQTRSEPIGGTLDFATSSVSAVFGCFVEPFKVSSNETHATLSMVSQTQNRIDQVPELEMMQVSHTTVHDETMGQKQSHVPKIKPVSIKKEVENELLDVDMEPIEQTPEKLDSENVEVKKRPVDRPKKYVKKERKSGDCLKEEGKTSASEKKEANTSASEKKEGKTSASEKKEGKTSASEKKEGKISASEKKEGKISASEKKEGKISASEKKEGKTSASGKKKRDLKELNKLTDSLSRSAAMASPDLDNDTQRSKRRSAVPVRYGIM